MNQEELRLECLKLALTQQNLKDPIELANIFYNFVKEKETKINLKNPIEFINQYFKLLSKETFSELFSLLFGYLQILVYKLK